MRSLQTALAMGATVWCSACGPTSVPGFPAEDGFAGQATAPPRSVIHPAETRGDGHDAYGDIEARSAKTARADKRDEPLPVEQGKRIGATGPHVWIMPEPSSKGLALGNIRLGTSVTLRDEPPQRGEGCGQPWYPVQPRGWVCLGPRTTLDLSDRYYRALHDVAPERGALYPYRYAYSRGAPMYSRVPTPQEWKRSEMKYGPAGSYDDLGEWAKGHEELIVADRAIEATDPVPWFFEGGKRQVGGGTRNPDVLVWKTIPNGSMLAYARAFEMHDRVWLVTPDLTIVPADRVQYIEPHTFHGVALEGGVELPIGWNRTKQPQPLYQRQSDGSFAPMGEHLPAKGWAMITGERSGSDADSYYELRERPGVYMRKAVSTVSWRRKELPRAIKPGEKWLDAGIASGTLTAYEGLRPVFTTLFSPGKGGAPVPGLDHSKYATTQTGYFRFEWKEAVATMSNEPGEPKVLWFSDVPHIQYIRAPLAMHVAYWHQDFSNPKSAECVNLSASDGRWMFEWTDPELPDEWGAVRPGGGFGGSTPIMINGF